MKYSVAIFVASITIGFTGITVMAQETDSVVSPAVVEENVDEATPEETINTAAERGTDEIVETANAVREGDFSHILPLLIKYGVPVISSLLILIVAYFFGKFLARVGSAPVKKRVDQTLGQFVSKSIFYAVMIFAVLGILGKFGISVASFAAVLASAGFAIGLAFQGTLGNFSSGVLLLVFRPFKTGDVINAAGITAKVVEIDLFHTVFDTFDNRRIIVPNGSIASGTIENITHHSERRVDVAVGVSYDAGIEKTRETLTAAAESLKEHLVEGEGRGYQIVLGDLGDSSVNWTVRFWTQAEDFWPVKQALTEAVKNNLDEANIGIPFPQMDVHLFKEVASSE